MSNIKFKGVMPALVTPLDKNGEVNSKSVAPLVNYCLDRGQAGFYVGGSTGEGPVLGREARMKVAEATVNAAKSRTTVDGASPSVIIHVASPNPLDAFALAKHAEEIGADAVSSLAPSFYFGYNENEMLEYYKRLAASSNLPILIYATPLLKTADVKAFVEKAMKIDNIIGLKFTIRDYFHLGRIKEINGGDINVINGPDETLLCGLVMGADGGIGTTYNLIPEKFAALYKAFCANDMKLAHEIQIEINHVIDTVMHCSSNYIAGIKEALNLKGFDVGGGVFPAHRFDETELKALKAKLEAVGVEF